MSFQFLPTLHSGHFDDRNGSSGDKIWSRRLLRELCDGLLDRRHDRDRKNVR